jgi:hypothetical protein
MVLNQPQTTTWGPALWFILHVAAEKVGRNPIAALQVDEVRELEMLVRSFPFTLPCPNCQRHSYEYMQAHPITWGKLKGPDATPVIRQWFFDFHNHVNGAKTEPTAAFAIEDVESKYAHVTSVSDESITVLLEIHKAINHNWVKHDAAQRFKRHLGILRGFLGI